MSGTVIPPPNPIPPPSDAGEQSDADLKQRKATRKKAEEEDEGPHRRPARVGGVVVTYVGGPLLLLVLLLGAVVGFKAWRRHRRRSADSPSARFVGAWRELVDHARDLGQVVPLGPTVTRREQSAGIVSGQAGSLARRADSFVFGPSAPEVGRSDLLGVGRRRAARDVAGGRSLAAPQCRDQPALAAATSSPPSPDPRTRPTATPAPPPRPGVSPVAGPARPSQIGVLARRLTKLARRPNVGCVSWRLAAARTSTDSSQTARSRARDEVLRSRPRGPPDTRSRGPGRFAGHR